MYASTARSSSRSGTPTKGTPIKAITSTLTARSAPAVPPPALLYEPLPKAVLRHRLVYNVFLLSLGASWVLTAWWSAWQRGGLDVIGIGGWVMTWLKPGTLVCAVLSWMMGALPVAVLRKVYVTATPTSSVSPQQTLRLHLAQPRTRRALLVLVVSSIALFLSHATMSYFIEMDGRGDPRIGVWGRSRKHPYHINGRFVYLVLTQVILALSFWLRDVLKDRFTIRWSRNADTVLSARTIIPHLTPSIISMVLLTTLSTAFATLLFGALRMCVFPVIYRVPVLHGLLRPFTAHFLRPKYTITFLWTHFDLIVRAYFLNVTTALSWDIPSTLFEVCSSIPVRATEGAKDPALLLVSGINSDDAFFQHHAFHELALLSSDQSDGKAKRAAIYNDTKYNPTVWASLVRRSLLLLGRDYQLLLRRGEPPVVAPALAPALAPKESEKPTTPIIHKPIFKTARSSPLTTLIDSLSSDGALTQALTQTSDEVAGVPELFRAASKAVPSPLRLLSSPTVSKAVATGGMGEVKGAVEGVKVAGRKAREEVAGWKAQAGDIVGVVRYAWGGTWWRDSAISGWWTRERKNKAAMKALPNKELDLMIVEVLTTLIAHSLTEDTLGVVQRDIPRVLEALSSYLSALEEYQAELSALYPTQTPEQQAKMSSQELLERERVRVEVILAGEWITGLTDTLRTGIGLITRTFGDRLLAFKFSPRTARKLQVFMEYAT